MPAPGETLNSLINLSLPAVPPEVFTNEQVRASVQLLINTANNLLRGVEQYTGITQKDANLWSQLSPSDTILRQNAGRFYVIAGEDLSFGHFVYIYNDAGVAKVKKASSFIGGAPKAAKGFCTSAVLTGEFTEVILSQGLLQINGIVPGDELFLSTTAGVASLTPDATSAHLRQYLGVCVETGLAYIDIAPGLFVVNP